MEERTTALRFTVSGLVSLDFGKFIQCRYSYPNFYQLIASGCSKDREFVTKDFEARVSLALEFLQMGADPNAKVSCNFSEIESHGNSLDTQNIRDATWSDFLKMMTADSYPCEGERLLHNFDLVPSWVALTMGFLKRGAHPRQLVHGLTQTIMLSTGTFEIKFEFVSEPLPIIMAYFRDDVRGRPILGAIQQQGGQEKVSFTKVSLNVENYLRRVFTEIFDITDPSVVANGASWDVTDGILDHLGTEILSSTQPLWDAPEIKTDELSICDIPELRLDPWSSTKFDLLDVASKKKPRPYTFEVLRKVLILLNDLAPLEIVDPPVQITTLAEAGYFPEASHDPLAN